MSLLDIKDSENIVSTYKDGNDWYWRILRPWPWRNGESHGPFTTETEAVYDAQSKVEGLDANVGWEFE